MIRRESFPHLIEFMSKNAGGLKGSAYPRRMNFSCTPGFACGRGVAMNVTANFSNLTWAAMAHAGWQARVVARKGDCAEVIFAAPTGGELGRLVPIDRLHAPRPRSLLCWVRSR